MESSGRRAEPRVFFAVASAFASASRALASLSTRKQPPRSLPPTWLRSPCFTRALVKFRTWHAPSASRCASPSITGRPIAPQASSLPRAVASPSTRQPTATSEARAAWPALCGTQGRHSSERTLPRTTTSESSQAAPRTPTGGPQACLLRTAPRSSRCWLSPAARLASRPLTSMPWSATQRAASYQMRWRWPHVDMRSAAAAQRSLCC
mmetsp:Transcript_71548/g.155452  ORF Transcript_71548/g.155452 Transcript_71548/m.155452 type:complete len:208 (+) Transcript_71548:1388-2011(+)